MKINQLIRDKSITCLLLLALALSFFITFIGGDIILQMKSETATREKEDYEYEYTWYYSSEGYMEREVDETITLVPDIEVGQGNLILGGVNVSIANSVNTVPLELVMSSKEEIKHDFLWGELSNKKNTVVIYESLGNYTYERESNIYITIEKEEYRVTGVIRETGKGYYDSGCFMSYDSVSEDLKEYISAYYSDIGNLNIVEFFSDTRISEEQLQYVTDWCKTWCGEREVTFELGTQMDEDVDYNEKDRMSFYFSIVLLVFSLVNCIVIANTWIERRRKEFIIRKTYGESAGQIFQRLFVELSQHAAVCGILIFLFKSIFQIVRRDFTLSDLFFNFIILLAAIVILSLAIGLAMIAKIARIKPGKALKEYQ
ncbi:MAG: ABC transporter permease [Lachnospiraceae bacterium]|nr:ABC transporter permease [Lachnospiraceae bacterium]